MQPGGAAASSWEICEIRTKPIIDVMLNRCVVGMK